MTSRTLVADHLTPTLAYAKLRAASKSTGARFLYESAVSGERWARYSILGYAPTFELRIDRDVGWSKHGNVPAGIELRDHGPLLERLQLDKVASGVGPARFERGLFGDVAYDLVHAIAKVPPGPVYTWDAHYVPLARLFAQARVLRLADGPDEVHRAVVARIEQKRQAGAETAP
jgi:anthranilate/para-aminobenzoate synthase component I